MKLPLHHIGQSLLSLALLFLLVTAPDFGTLDPVLVSLQPLNQWKGKKLATVKSYTTLGGIGESETNLPSWFSHRQSGQNTKLHFEELHSALDADTREGEVHNGQCVNLSPAVKHD